VNGGQEVVGSNPAAPTNKLLLLGEFLIPICEAGFGLYERFWNGFTRQYAQVYGFISFFGREYLNLH
jgi:hypothetical protein